MSETTERPRMCVITHVLPAAVIEMLREAPLNPTARAHVLAHTNRPIPQELATFEQIVEWIETNIRPQPPLDPFAAAQVQPPRIDPLWPLSVPVDYEDIETGNATYQVRRYGGRRIPVSSAQLRDIVEQANSMTDAVERIRTFVEETADEQWPEMEWSEDGPEHNYHDPHTGQDTLISTSSAWVRERLAQWMITTNQVARLNELQGETNDEPEEENEPDEDRM